MPGATDPAPSSGTSGANAAGKLKLEGAQARLPHLWVHTFDTVEELRRALRDFVAHYNATWLVARHGYQTPDQIRAEQRRLAQCTADNLPLAA
jgi:hypothetical protein